MSTHFPRVPRRGEDVLLWARQISDYVRQLIIREGADVVPDISSAGTRLRLRKKGRQPDAVPPPPFYVVPSNTSGADGDGWVKVLATGTVLNSIDASDNCTVTGLDVEFQLDLDASNEQYIWLRIDISGDVNTGHVGHGQDWNGDSGDFFPDVVEFDTDDGTPEGSDGGAPSDRSQLAVYWPLARTYNIEDNPFPGLDLPGFMLTETVMLVNIGNMNLRLEDGFCYKGNEVTLLMPWHGAIPG